MARYTSLLTSKITIAILVVVLALLGKMEYSQWQKRQSIEREIRALSDQQQSLEQKNQELSDSLSYLNTADYKEKMARQQLNMQKKDEIVVNFSDKISQDASAPVDTAQSNGSNLEKWWLYFFKR